MPVPSLPGAVSAAPRIDVAAQLKAAMRSHEFAAGASAAAVILAPPSFPFFLRHHRENWRVSHASPKSTLLPEVTMFRLAPGANGVRTRNKDEQPDAGYRQALRNEIDKGWMFLDPSRVIPASCLPSGVSEGSYIRRVECVHPVTLQAGELYLEAWNVPQPAAGSATTFKFDRAAYERWLLWLVESGQIAGPSQDNLDAAKQRAADHLHNRNVAAYGNEEVAKHLRGEAAARLKAASAATLPTVAKAKGATS